MRKERLEFRSEPYGIVPLLIGGAIAAGAAATASTGFNIWDRITADRDRKDDNAFQREQFEYLKDQNKLMQDREDNAIQRRRKDMEAAGLHPTLAAGSAAQAGAAQAPHYTNASREPVGAPDANMIQLVQGAMQLKQMHADYEYTKAQTKLINRQSDDIGKDREQRDTHFNTQMDFQKAQAFMDNYRHASQQRLAEKQHALQETIFATNSTLEARRVASLELTTVLAQNRDRRDARQAVENLIDQFRARGVADTQLEEVRTRIEAMRQDQALAQRQDNRAERDSLVRSVTSVADTILNAVRAFTGRP